VRLLAVRPVFFRGCRDTPWLNLDSPLVLLYGPNAFAKTSFAEAIEWLLRGTTSRRSKGDSYWREEYRGSYRNAHAPDEAPTSVFARVPWTPAAQTTAPRPSLMAPRRASHPSDLCPTRPSSRS